MTPRVSICVPNLNMLPFLPGRFESIFAQTFQDWELFVYDSHSDDGAWEYMQGLAVQEKRMRLVQGPREGPYPAWNECLKQTTGEFVYIATSDDTMAPDCLEKMVAALDRNADCGLAHCPLRVIDKEGAVVLPARWPAVTVFAHGMAEIVDRAHVRNAPYDGMIHLTGRHVYLSVAQLLIRRSLFAKVGPFPNKWGNISDFNWEMKAGLVTNTVHVPDTWVSWRIHDKQATETVKFHSRDRDRKLEEMIADALQSCAPHLSPKVVNSHWFKTTKNLRDYYAQLEHEPSKLKSRLYQILKLISGPPEIRSELLRSARRQPLWPRETPQQIRQWLESEGLGPTITDDPA